MTRIENAEFVTPTPEQMDLYMAEARRLRGEATRDMVRKAFAMIRRVGGANAAHVDVTAARRA
jgi:hypothetical protein